MRAIHDLTRVKDSCGGLLEEGGHLSDIFWVLTSISFNSFGIVNL